ncbi:DUF2939 domain-containing protein [Phenylobacterium sp.]|uniref:DUF2939 domain-containing protein n=1 Tax=Phenylobacterium sp. TaxID=1871053 RepID=UPI0025F9B10C|nr:DUF2939 domain-containing protein [Phenylobacterium sp.]
MRRLPLLAAVLALSLSACATVQKLPAAGDVHALLISIRDEDRATFDSLVDRKALKHEIQGRLVERASKDKRLSGVAALLAPSLADLVGESVVQPKVFKAVAEHYGYTPATKIPNILAISQALRQLPDGRICAISKKDGPCLLDFTKAPDGHWKLSGFEGDVSMLRLKG